MADPGYQDYFVEVGSNAMESLIKQEPELGAPSASVPIPGGHRSTRGVYDQFSPSPLSNPIPWGMRNEPVDSPILVDTDPLGLKMDDDDIFQVLMK